MKLHANAALSLKGPQQLCRLVLVCWRLSVVLVASSAPEGRGSIKFVTWRAAPTDE